MSLNSCPSNAGLAAGPLQDCRCTIGGTPAEAGLARRNRRTAHTPLHRPGRARPTRRGAGVRLAVGAGAADAAGRDGPRHTPRLGRYRRPVRHAGAGVGDDEHAHARNGRRRRAGALAHPAGETRRHPRRPQRRQAPVRHRRRLGAGGGRVVRHRLPPALDSDTGGRGRDEGAVDPGASRAPRRLLRLPARVLLPEAGPEAASAAAAGHQGRRVVSAHRRVGRRLAPHRGDPRRGAPGPRDSRPPLRGGRAGPGLDRDIGGRRRARSRRGPRLRGSRCGPGDRRDARGVREAEPGWRRSRGRSCRPSDSSRRRRTAQG